MYDAIILGAGISGLMSANILSRAGLRVLVLEKAPKWGGMLQGFGRRGVHFDTGLHYVGGLGPGEPLARIFRYHHLLELPWVRLDCNEEVVQDGEAFLVPCGFHDFVNGMSGYFPGEETPLRNYADALKSVSERTLELADDRLPLFEKSAATFLEETLPNPRLRQILSGTGFRMDMDLEHLSFYEYAQINASFLESTWRLAAPSSLLADILAGQIQSRGGEIRCNCPVQRIGRHQVQAGGSCFRGETLISSLPPATTVHLCDSIRESYASRIL